MSNVLKVKPEEIIETGNDLKRLSLETQEIVKQFSLLLDKMQLQWEGNSQKSFDDSARNSIRQMEEFALLCKKYSDDILEMSNCYISAESLFASDVNNRLPAELIE